MKHTLYIIEHLKIVRDCSHLLSAWMVGSQAETLGRGLAAWSPECDLMLHFSQDLFFSFKPSLSPSHAVAHAERTFDVPPLDASADPSPRHKPPSGRINVYLCPSEAVYFSMSERTLVSRKLV